MQRPRSLFAVLLASLMALPMMGCEIAFTVTEEFPPHTIEGSTLPLPIETTWQLNVENQSEYQSRNFDHIKEVWIRELVFEIQDSTPDETFEFLTSIEVRISAEIEGSNEEEIVAWVPNGDPQLETRRLKFNTTNVELLQFIEAPGGYEVTVEYVGQAPDNDVDIGGYVQYRLKVGR